MARTRHGRPRGFAAIPNTTIDDAQNLDLMALGLLTVLLRQKDGWEITMERVGKKYGYGRDALANAMGLLQVAHYVVKVRVQDSGTAQWSTEIITYDTPASDEEIGALLDDIAAESGVADVRLIEPTPTAAKRAQARAQKLQTPKNAKAEFPQVAPSAGKPAVGETETDIKGDPECRVSRQSANPAVSKKTVLEEHSLPLTPSRGDTRAALAPSAGASGEEEDFYPEEENWCDGAANGPGRPSRRLAVVPAPQESEESEIGPQGDTRRVAICRECWSTYFPQEAVGQRLCPSCR
jgi:hypothetical protein